MLFLCYHRLAAARVSEFATINDNTTQYTYMQAMMIEIMEVYTDMINCSLFLDAYDGLSKKRKEKLGEWVPFDDDLMENSGYWLPQIVRQIRDTVHQLQSLDLPSRAVQLTQQLAFNVRTLCSQTMFHRAARGEGVVHACMDQVV